MAPSLPTRTSPRQARSARTLDLILDAAERLFHERGVVETSTVDVAAAAQVSVGRLYYWFPDKTAVVDAVMRRGEEQLRARLADDPDMAARPLPERIERVVSVLGSFFREHPGTLAVLARGPVGPVDHGASMCSCVASVAGSLIEFQSSGVAPDESDLVARTITNIVITTMSEYLRSGEEHGELVLAELCSLLAAYLQCRSPNRLVPRS